MVSLTKMRMYLQDLLRVKVDLWRDGRTYRANVYYKGHYLGYFVRSGSNFKLYTHHYVYGIDATPARLITHIMIICINIDKGGF